MKKLIFIPVLLCFLSLNLTSCTSSSSSTFDPQTLIKTVKKKTWRVTSYVDSGTEETSHFAGYNFTFSDPNVITVTNGTNTYTGTWSVRAAVDEDTSNQELYLTVVFTSPADFLDISREWYVASYTSKVIYLVENNAGGGDVLVLNRN